MQQRFRIRVGEEQQFGPTDEGTIRNWYCEGRIEPTDVVQREGATDWIPLGRAFNLSAWEHASVLASFVDGRVTVVVGDITRQRVEAIVNAANTRLLGGSGVDGAIHEAGGPEILDACRHLRATRLPNGLPTGMAVETTAGLLPAKYVIHTVGPVWGAHSGHEAELLAAAYQNTMKLAVSLGLQSVAFPSISTGFYSYPLIEAAAISSRTVQRFLQNDTSLSEVRLVFYSHDLAAEFIMNHAFDSVT